MTLAIIALSFVLAAAAPDIPGPPQLTAQQKMAATAPFVKSATDCIVRAVTADARSKNPNAVPQLIVEAMPQCVTPARAMIYAYDRYFGAGTGEAFFMGPYLDVLPKAVEQYKRQGDAH